MSDKKLQQDIQRLRRELDQATGEGTEAKEKLSGIVKDLERHLEEPDNQALHRDLVSNIREAIENFETKHPRATAILNDIMVTLSNLGI